MTRDDVASILEGIVKDVAQRPGVTTRPGLSSVELDQVEDGLGLSLPPSYRIFLGLTNGMEVGFGFLRVLGAGPRAPIDLMGWNSPEVWKFAWDWLPFTDLRQILVVGMDLYGNPIGFRHDELGAAEEPRLVTVMSLWPSERQVSDNFLSWVTGPIANHAHQPLSEDPVLERYGAIPPDQLVLIDLPMLVGEPQVPELTVVMDAASVAIGTGDLMKGADVEDTSEVEQVVPWVDDRGRRRLRVELARRTGREGSHG